MATTFVDYTGDGNATKSFSFPSIKEADIKVDVDGDIKTSGNHYNITSYTTTGGGNIVFTSGNIPASPAAIRIFRDTDVDAAKATFVAGSSVKAGDLNNNMTQILYAAQEEQNQTVLTSDIKDAAVTTAKIKDANVTTAKIANDAVTADKIPNDAINSEHYAATSIDTEHIANENVTTAKLANDAVTSAKLADNAVLTANITDANVTRAKIEADAIDGTKIANDSINSEHYVDGSIDTAHIADSQVTTAKIADSNVTTAKIANDAVTADKIADAVIVTASEQAAASANDTTFFTTSASDARYFNVSTGDTIKDGDTFPDNDTTIATTAAINDRIIDLVDDVGGFVPIANELSFPNSNPDVNNGAGTLISIKSLSQNLTSNGSGVISISNGTVGNSTVTIVGAANSTTYASGFGLIVETHADTNKYTFHRLVPKATEVTTVAGISSNVTTVAGISSNVTTVAGISSNVTTVAGNNSNVTAVAGNNSNITAVADNETNINAVKNNATNINTVAGANSNITTVAGSIANVNTTASNIANVNNFSNTYQIASSNPSTDGGGNSLAEGDLYFNTTANELKVYNGSTWQGGVTATGNLAGLGANTFTGNQTLQSTNPKLLLTDTNANSDYSVHVDGGVFYVRDETNTTNRLEIQSDGTVDVIGNLDAQGGLDVTGNITVSGNVDGRDVAADGTKLDGIESSATADQTAAEIRTLVESASDSNVFTDADHSKLNAIEASATADQTASEIVALVADQTIAPSEIDMEDSEKIKLGTGDDLQLYHDGSNTYLDNSTGELSLRSDTIRLRGKTGNETLAVFEENDAAKLYFNNSKKLETTSTGITTTGQVKADVDTALNSDTEYNGQDFGFLVGYDGGYDANSEGNGICFAQQYASGDASIVRTGAIIGYKQNSAGNFGGGLKFKTQKVGANPMGTALQLDQQQHVLIPNDDTRLKLGASQDLQIYHDGSHNRIDSSNGNIYLRHGTDNAIMTVPNGAVNLYYDDSKKLETTSGGVTVTGNLTCTSLLPTGNLELVDSNAGNVGRIRMGAGDDFVLYHDGSNSHLLNNTGELRVAGDTLKLMNGGESETYLYAVNNGAVELNYDNGKKFETTSDGIKVSGDIRFNSPPTKAMSFPDNKRIYFGDGDDFWIGSNGSNGEFAGEVYVYDHMTFYDNKRLRIGSGTDLQIYHDGNNSFLDASGTGSLNLYGDDIGILNKAKSEWKAKFITDGAVELYHNGNKKFETTGYGIGITGNATSSIVTVSDGSNITVPLNTGTHFVVTLGGNRTFVNSGMQASDSVGSSGSVFIVQDGTGGRSASFQSTYKFAGGTAPTLSTAANAVDRLDYVVRSTNEVHCVVTLDVK